MRQSDSVAAAHVGPISTAKSSGRPRGITAAVEYLFHTFWRGGGGLDRFGETSRLFVDSFASLCTAAEQQETAKACKLRLLSGGDCRVMAAECG